jgi:alanyl-tRNA synthetase
VPAASTTTWRTWATRRGTTPSSRCWATGRFGDYFKRESLKWAWELLTQVYKLPAEKLWATVYIEDDEAYDIWTKDIGLPPERVVRIGDNKGARYARQLLDDGRHRPLRPVLGDLLRPRPAHPRRPARQPGAGRRPLHRDLEQRVHAVRHAAGRLGQVRCPRPASTPAWAWSGWPRSCSTCTATTRSTSSSADQGRRPRDAHRDLANNSLRVIADHIRATSFLVADGVIPSNEGRGYVQRRIIRRAIRHGYKLGQKTPFFHKLVPTLVKLMGEAYPHLAAAEKRVMEVLKAEEERFYETWPTAWRSSTPRMQEGGKKVAGRGGFQAARHLRLPARPVARRLPRARKLRSTRPASTPRWKSRRRRAAPPASSRWTARWNTAARATSSPATSGWRKGQGRRAVQGRHAGAAARRRPARRRGAGHHALLFGERRPGRRQRHPRGEGVQFGVEDTQKIKADVFGHHGTQTQGTLKVGDAVKAASTCERRAATMRNHSRHAPDAQGAARGAGRPRAAEGLAGRCRQDALRLHAQQPGDARSRSARSRSA